MKWYDYLWCIMLADLITAALLGFNMGLLSIGFGGYIMYEKMRKSSEGDE